MPREKRSDRSTVTPADKTADNSGQTPTVTIEGSRIINIHKLQQYIDQLTSHATRCVGGRQLFCRVRCGMDWHQSCRLGVQHVGTQSCWRQPRKLKGPEDIVIGSAISRQCGGR